MLPEESQREKIIATIDEMTAMTEEILSWTKNAAGLEEPAAVDLHSLLSSIVDDFVDQGQKITLQCDADIVLNVRRLSMKRALSNVINNAIKYGHSADVSVKEYRDSILIHVDDQGPGIPDHLLADALKPFVRLEASRNKDTGGSGLGLSISETVVQAEGGKLMFENLRPKGLRVTISLPR
jgi:signal transduction histidine kinase